jgi:hypothetical protein
MTQATQEPWLYCSYCERAFRSHSKDRCRYDRCEGNLGDIWEWEILLSLNRSYPVVPVPGVEYPLFGDGSLTNLRRAGRTGETRQPPEGP